MPESAADRFRIPSLRERVSPAEWQARIDLAACYRLMEIYGMADMGANHVSLAVPGEEGAFLINSYGMLYEEITASSLQKIDLHGNVLMKPDFPDGIGYGVNRAGFVIHGAIHAAKPELACVIHTHTWAGMAVSSLECGLLPMTQTAMRFARIGYHDYEGVVLDLAMQEKLVRDLGDFPRYPAQPRLLTWAAPSASLHLDAPLELSCGRSWPRRPPGEDRRGAGGVVEETWNNYQPGTRRPYGVLEWPALLRKLDRIDPGYRE